LSTTRKFIGSTKKQREKTSDSKRIKARDPWWNDLGVRDMKVKMITE